LAAGTGAALPARHAHRRRPERGGHSGDYLTAHDRLLAAVATQRGRLANVGPAI
jgi:hypothetical protein